MQAVTAKAYRNVRRALGQIGDELEIDLASHDFRGSLASYLIIAARADDGTVTGLMSHSDISITRRLYADDWREAEERNESFCASSQTLGSASDTQMLTKMLTTPVSVYNPENESSVYAGLFVMGGTGLEPVTPSLSNRGQPCTQARCIDHQATPQGMVLCRRRRS